MSPFRQYRVIWSPSARDDLDGIADFIGQDSPDVAVNLVNEIHQRAASLCAMPLRGRIVPELKELPITSYRELVHRLWRIVYEVRGDEVKVLAVLDARRDFIQAFQDRLTR
jgi:addiction module RelE/StbE family toxin